MGFMGEQTIGSLSRAAGINSITRENEETENRKKRTGEPENRGTGERKKQHFSCLRFSRSPILRFFLSVPDSPILIAMGRERTPQAER
jgi:hypothetical protein